MPGPERRRRAILVGLALCAAGLGGGCGAYRESEARAREQMLLTAGFSIERASTPEERARFAALPGRRLVEQPGPGGAPAYLFADPEGCCCVYVGNAEQHARNVEIAAHVERERKRDLDVALFGESSQFAQVPPDPPSLVALPESRGCPEADL